MTAVPERPEEDNQTPELELQMVVSRQVCARHLGHLAQSVLVTAQPPFQPLICHSASKPKQGQI